MTPADLVGKLRIVLFGHFDALLRFSSTGYSPDVADHSVIGLGNPSNRNATAPLTNAADFMAAILSNGGCAWDAFGRAGSLVPGFPTCVQLPPIRLETNVAASRTQE